MQEKEIEKGSQPLDAVMNELGLKNQDLVAHSTEQLTHKNVAKGRSGRQLTLNIRHKILNALNACQSSKQYTLSDLFNY